MDEFDGAKAGAFYTVAASRTHEGNPVKGYLGNDPCIGEDGLEAEIIEMLCAEASGSMEEHTVARVVDLFKEIEVPAQAPQYPILAGSPYEGFERVVT